MSCVAILLLLLQLLLLVAAVRHRVSDGKICCCGSLHLIPVFLFLFIETRFIFDVPFGSTLAFTASIFYLLHLSHVLGNYGHARSQDGR